MNPIVHVTRNNFLSGSVSPIGTVTPDFKGQQYLKDNGVLFLAKGLTPDSWTEVSGASVTLNNTVTSTSTTEAATANAVKQAYDKADQAFQSASNGKNKIASSITGMGIEASNTESFDTLSEKIKQIKTRAIFS